MYDWYGEKYKFDHQGFNELPTYYHTVVSRGRIANALCFNQYTCMFLTFFITLLYDKWGFLSP
jgi:hypothetical protein